MRAFLVYKICAFILACNYFAFRVELFDEERETNEPKLPDGCAFANCSLTWETFDKDNAPKAFVFNAIIPIVLYCIVLVQVSVLEPSFRIFQPIRDKSPPFTSSCA